MATWAPLRTAKTYIVGLLIIGFLAFLGWQVYQYTQYLQYQRAPLTIAGSSFDMRVVSSNPQREKGLSGTPKLDKTDGMLFVFENDDTWGIWMKDMLIPIDIVWLNSEKKVVYMVKDADPSSYPHTTYRPARKARYVAEFQAGTIERRNIQIGDQAAFDLSDIEEQ